MPRLAASSLIDLLSATRQSLSAPTCAKPTVSFLPAAGFAAAPLPVAVSGAGLDCLLQAVRPSNRAAANANRFFFIRDGMFLAGLRGGASKKTLQQDKREQQPANGD